MEKNLTLITPTKAEAAELLGSPAFFRGLAVCPEALPPAFFLECGIASEKSDWLMPRLFVDEGEGRVVGSGGFKHVPCEGRVEIGYGVAPSCRGRGYATAAVLRLCAEGFGSGMVTEILAQTSLPNQASRRVLEKAGFASGGFGIDDRGPVSLWKKVRRL